MFYLQIICWQWKGDHVDSSTNVYVSVWLWRAAPPSPHSARNASSQKAPASPAQPSQQRPGRYSGARPAAVRGRHWKTPFVRLAQRRPPSGGGISAGVCRRQTGRDSPSPAAEWRSVVRQQHRRQCGHGADSWSIPSNTHTPCYNLISWLWRLHTAATSESKCSSEVKLNSYGINRNNDLWWTQKEIIFMDTTKISPISELEKGR